MNAPLYFFGVQTPKIYGHYLYTSAGSRAQKGYRIHNWHSIGPFPTLDSALAPQGEHLNREGAAALHQRYDFYDGSLWTAVSFWDFSGDERRNSNSAFVIQEPHTFEEMCSLAQEQYPRIWNRLTVQPFLVYTDIQKAPDGK